MRKEVIIIKILIDADGCPVVDETVLLAQKHCVPCTILSDTSHNIERDGAESLVYSQGKDSVDFALVNMVTRGDIVITQDYGLAAMCLAKHGIPMNQNGMLYTHDNIDSLLLSRHLHKTQPRRGIKGNHIKKRTLAQDRTFFHALDAVLVETAEGCKIY